MNTARANPDDKHVPVLKIGPDRRRATKVGVTILIVCTIVVATGCFIVMAKPGQELISWRMARGIAYTALMVNLAYLPALIAFYYFEKRKRWVVGEEGIEIYDPHREMEFVRWKEIEDVQIREHGVNLVVLPDYKNRSICFVDPEVARTLAQLHLSMTTTWGR